MLGHRTGANAAILVNSFLRRPWSFRQTLVQPGLAFDRARKQASLSAPDGCYGPRSSCSGCTPPKASGRRFSVWSRSGHRRHLFRSMKPLKNCYHCETYACDNVGAIRDRNGRAGITVDWREPQSTADATEAFICRRLSVHPRTQQLHYDFVECANMAYDPDHMVLVDGPGELGLKIMPANRRRKAYGRFCCAWSARCFRGVSYGLT